MFPGILFLLPLFVIFVNLSQDTGINLYGSRTGLIITYMTFTLPFAIWMLAAYLDTIPRELDEAATVDGTGPLGAFIRVVIPAAIPGIVAVGIYAFMTAWSEMLFASVLTNDSTRTLAVGLQGYATQNQVYWNHRQAGPVAQHRLQRDGVPADALAVHDRVCCGARPGRARLRRPRGCSRARPPPRR